VYERSHWYVTQEGKKKRQQEKIAAHAVFDFLNAAKKSLKVMDLYFNRSKWVLCLY